MVEWLHLRMRFWLKHPSSTEFPASFNSGIYIERTCRGTFILWDGYLLSSQFRAALEARSWGPSPCHSGFLWIGVWVCGIRFNVCGLGFRVCGLGCLNTNPLWCNRKFDHKVKSGGNTFSERMILEHRNQTSPNKSIAGSISSHKFHVIYWLVYAYDMVVYCCICCICIYTYKLKIDVPCIGPIL